MNLQVLTDPESTNNSAHHGIFMATGSVTLENMKSNSFARGGSMVYLGTTDKEAGSGKGRSTPTTDETRTITVKNCNITSTTRTGATFLSAAPAKISGSTLKLTKNSSSGKTIFVPAPQLEGNYTAIAGLAKNADKPDKLKEYAEGKLGSYTYILVTPAGGSSSNPDYNGNPQDGDNTALALFMTLMAVSAISIAGVSVIGKKKHF